MKIIDHFTSVSGEIIRLVEYENKFERLYNGWKYGIKKISGTSESFIGIESIDSAIDKFSKLRFFDCLEKERRRLSALAPLSSYKYPEFFNIIAFLKSCQITRVSYDWAGFNETTVFFKKFSISSDWSELPKRYQEILNSTMDFSVILVFGYDIVVVDVSINNHLSGEIFRSNNGDKFYSAYAAF